MKKKLQILIPQYKEDESIIKPLLDSIEVQQNVDLKNDIDVIIVNDGTDTHLSQEFFNRYSFPIEYHLNEHKGVSATRNACLDYATADYVMFCDADDIIVSSTQRLLCIINVTGFFNKAVYTQRGEESRCSAGRQHMVWTCIIIAQWFRRILT